MKILAVRLAEIGCFSRGVALEGLSGGLNVLAGANEAGKSTVLAALRLAFEQSYKTTSSKVEAMRPYSGGAPVVEVDFALGATTWRLRKQYLTARAAELRNLATGQISRGADAEQLLADILGQSAGRAPFSLLWASQKDALVPIVPDNDAASTLKRTVSAHIAATVGGSEARDVRAAVRAELDQFLTNHKPPRPKGEYDAAIKVKARLEGDLTLAAARRDAALTRLDRLSDLKAEEEAQANPAQVAARVEAAQQSAATAAAARDAHQKLRAASEAVSAAEARLDLARAKRDSLAADLERLETLAAEVIADQDGARDLASAVAQAEADALEARAARDRYRSELAAAERELKAAAAVEKRQADAARLATLAETVSAAEAAIAVGLALRARLDAIRVSPDAMRELRSLDDAIRRLEDRLAAAAPKLRVTYAPGGAGRIRVGTDALGEGPHLVDQPMLLTIDGIGTIEIAPGIAEGSVSTEEELARKRADLAANLAAAGVATVEEAEAKLAEAQGLDAELREARARLGALVPSGGVAKLKDEIAVLSAAAASSEEEACLRCRSDVEREIDSLRAALRACEPADETAQAELSRQRQAMARHAATSDDRLKRLSELESRVPAIGVRSSLLAELQAAVSEGERGLHAAVREASAWREEAPSPDQLRALEAEAAQTAEAVRTFERQREERSRTIASLEGELRADRNDDVEARVVELESALAVAVRRLSRLDDEIAALQLLDVELRAEEMRSQDRYLQPVSERLAPLVGLVFPDADVTMADNFVPASLRRGSGRETIAALSGGTQEQLAVLVRLAFGKLMADSGSPVPVILDDALVYSDDERMLRRCAALRLAARDHQLIVLTCRSRTFASLDARRLSLAPWSGETASDDRLSISA